MSMQDAGYTQGTHTAAPASDVHQQTGLAKLSMELLPSLANYGTEKPLTKLGTKLATLQVQAHPLK